MAARGDSVDLPARRARAHSAHAGAERAPRRAVRPVGQLLIAVLAVASLQAFGVDATWDTGATAPRVRLARDSRATRSLDDDDRDVEVGRERGRPSVPRLPGEKSPAGGYDPQRVHRFWRHYHGAPHERKAKPLEHEK